MKIYEVIFSIGHVCIVLSGVLTAFVVLMRSIYVRSQKGGQLFDLTSDLNNREKRMLIASAILFVLFIGTAFLGIYLRDVPR